MKANTLEIIVEKEQFAIAESIIFRTAFLLSNGVSILDDLKYLEMALQTFISENYIQHSGPKLYSMDNDGFEYQYPQYRIQITNTDFPKLEQFLVKYPQISLTTQEVFLSEEQKQDLLEGLIAQAKAEARQISNTGGLNLVGTFKMSRIVSPTSSWNVVSPIAVSMHQKHAITYEFIFNVEH
ncbi:hypothetical protein [Dyadobacter sp. CY326]|uniref:hypothetical protein n=1 Tax=Dyadobacter sp. CY326 TaxID=2907300 RepID=UPI001F3D1020|nr:hypothetical protein [Dyadobacter sp. CY326]MCE7067166.1 hypothetical protein [Dyadobacter sp. CY326]